MITFPDGLFGGIVLIVQKICFTFLACQEWAAYVAEGIWFVFQNVSGAGNLLPQIMSQAKNMSLMAVNLNRKAPVEPFHECMPPGHLYYPITNHHQVPTRMQTFVISIDGLAIHSRDS